MPKSILSGKLGAWIWQPQSCLGGDWKKIAQKAKDYGIGYLIVKMADNIRYSGWTKGKLLEVKKILGDNDVLLAGWNYSTPGTVKQQIDAITSLYQDGLDIFCVDAEAEWQIPNCEQVAEQFLLPLRNKIGKEALLFHAPLGILQYHAFPYYTFSKYCDYSAPQLYASEFNFSMDKTIKLGDQGWNDFFAKHPEIDKQSFAPITTSYGKEYPHVPGELKREDIIKFFDHYKNCDTMSFYSWDAASKVFWDTLKEINETNGSVFAPQTPDPVDEPLPIPDDPIIINPTPVPPEPAPSQAPPAPISNSLIKTIVDFLPKLFQWFKLK